MRTGFAEALLREAFLAIRDLRAQRRRERGLAAGEAARGLGKLLVVAPDQATAKHYLGVLRSWMPAAQSEVVAQLATADTPRAHEALASFRLRLRARLGEMVAAQAVEDEARRAGFQGGEAGPGLYHRYNAALKRVCGNKSRAEMTLAELDAAIGWLERNRLLEHLHLLDDDPRYAWTARKRGEWKPPVGRDKRSPSRL